MQECLKIDNNLNNDNLVAIYHNIVSEDAINLIKEFEGFSALPYNCIGGYATIGYGHVIRKGELFTKLTEEEAGNILKKDIAIAENAVMRMIDTEILQCQFDSLVSFVFNLGAGALQASSLRQKVNYDPTNQEIEDEFLKWIYAKGKKSYGLLRRRRAEAKLYFKDVIVT